VVTDAMLNALASIGKRNKIKPDYTELKFKKKLFQVHIKAQIARKVWGNQGFYPIMNETNEIFLQSIKVFEKIKELDHTKM
jgi:carboxyl-terminal processing protease